MASRCPRRSDSRVDNKLSSSRGDQLRQTRQNARAKVCCPSVSRRRCFRPTGANGSPFLPARGRCGAGSRIASRSSCESSSSFLRSASTINFSLCTMRRPGTGKPREPWMEGSAMTNEKQQLLRRRASTGGRHNSRLDSARLRTGQVSVACDRHRRSISPSRRLDRPVAAQQTAAYVAEVGCSGEHHRQTGCTRHSANASSCPCGPRRLHAAGDVACCVFFLPSGSVGLLPPSTRGALRQLEIRRRATGGSPRSAAPIAVGDAVLLGTLNSRAGLVMELPAAAMPWWRSGRWFHSGPVRDAQPGQPRSAMVPERSDARRPPRRARPRAEDAMCRACVSTKWKQPSCSSLNAAVRLTSSPCASSTGKGTEHVARAGVAELLRRGDRRITPSVSAPGTRAARA